MNFIVLTYATHQTRPTAIARLGILVCFAEVFTAGASDPQHSPRHHTGLLVNRTICFLVGKVLCPSEQATECNVELLEQALNPRLDSRVDFATKLVFECRIQPNGIILLFPATFSSLPPNCRRTRAKTTIQLLFPWHDNPKLSSCVLLVPVFVLLAYLPMPSAHKEGINENAHLPDPWMLAPASVPDGARGDLSKPLDEPKWCATMRSELAIGTYAYLYMCREVLRHSTTHDARCSCYHVIA